LLNLDLGSESFPYVLNEEDLTQNPILSYLLPTRPDNLFLPSNRYHNYDNMDEEVSCWARGGIPGFPQSQQDGKQLTGTLSIPNTPIAGYTPVVRQTGTTIVGVAGPDFVVLGADSKATAGGSGSILVVDNQASKLHWLTNTTIAAGAGTSADVQHLTRQAAVTLALQQKQSQVGNAPYEILPRTTTHKARYLLDHGHIIPVERAVKWLQDSLYKAGGQIQANLLVAGLDQQSIPRLFALHPHGSVDRNMPYAALGSGGYAAMGILEHGYAHDMTFDQALALVQRAVQTGGMANDLASGGIYMDICVIRSNGSVVYDRISVASKLENTNFVKEEDSSTISRDAGVNGFGNGVTSITPTTSSSASKQEHDDRWTKILHDYLKLE
jgi:20S proteasome subunit beta 2